MISGIFQGLSFLTIFASTVFDALQYYKTENVYILASFISLILTSFTFMFVGKLASLFCFKLSE